jgi:cathepsin B
MHIYFDADTFVIGNIDELFMINQKLNGETYKIGVTQFTDMSLENLADKYLVMDMGKKLNLRNLREKSNNFNLVENENYENFSPIDWRSKDVFLPVRDQGQCGSCWAFAASEVLSDRFCIASNGAVDVILSPQDLVSCDRNDLGCNGGYLDRSWNYLVNTGVVSDSCYPYTSGSGVTGTCRLSGGNCVDGSTPATKYHAASSRTYSSVEEIKTDIFTNGPVETGFLVYQDFMSYKGGIYRKSSNYLLGGHAVKVVGWGLDQASNTEYWVVANSWGTKWGENGHFRIAIGNCCNFEAQMISGLPRLDKSNFLY